MWKSSFIGIYPDAIAPGPPAGATPFIALRSAAFWTSCVAADLFPTRLKAWLV
jgi:hypothetical protein